jgi:hypothetical protein
VKPQQIGEVSRRGGWRGSPNSIAALFRCQVLYPNQRKCKRCRCIAMRGRDYCPWHAGVRAPTDAAGRAESRLLGRMERLGLLPLDLLALPAWRGLTGLPRAQRAPMRLAMVQAWDQRHGEPLHWARVQRRALHLANPPGGQAARPGRPAERVAACLQNV